MARVNGTFNRPDGGERARAQARAARAFTLAIVAIALTPASVGAAGYTGNLLQNPGAEAGAGGTNSETIVPPPDWTVTGEFTALKYGAEGGFPTIENGKSIGGAVNFFAGGNSEVSTASQTVSVAADAAVIDAGTEPATLSGDLGGYSSQEDNAEVTASYLSATNERLGSLEIGPVTAAERKGETELIAKSATGTVPAGTRSIQVVITSTRIEGEYNDGYADNVSLTLGTPSPAVFGSTGILDVPSEKVCLSRRAFSIHIRRVAGLSYRKVTVYVNGHSVSVSEGARLSAPVNLRGLPKGRYVVRITILTTTGQTITGTRTYRTCVAKKRR